MSEETQKQMLEELKKIRESVEPKPEPPAPPKKKGIWSGLTANYIRVYTKSGEDLTNKITEVKLERLYRDGVWGK